MLTQRTRQQWLTLFVVATAAIGSCESPTAPGGKGGIAVGSVVDGSLAAGDSVRTYTFTADSGAQYVIFAAALQGTLRVDMRDSTGKVPLGSTVVDSGGPPLKEFVAFRFMAFTTAVRILAVSGYPLGTAVKFELLVYRVDNAPEIRPAQFAIGDTISGETLDPIADVDVFTTQVQAGQAFVAVLEAPSEAGLGQLYLGVTDSSGAQLGFGYFPSGTPAHVTTGRMVARTTGTLQFRIQAAPFGGNGLPQFHGAYRFWTYAIHPAPEHRAAAIAFSSVIGGESVDKAGDVDEFTFTAAAGTEVNAFYQSAVPSHLEVALPSGLVLGRVSAAADTSLFRQFTGRMRLDSAGTYTVRVSGDGTALTDTGAYRVYLYPIDRRPENVPAAIVPGDTVAGEGIDLPGDIDEFTFSASAGEKYYAFLQAQSGSAATQLELDVVDAGGTALGSVQSVGTDTSLLGQITTGVPIRATGTYRVRVSGAGAGGGSTGPYRVFLYRVNPKPESLPDTLAFGDSLAGESLDVPGDVDEYRVRVNGASGANLSVALLGTAPSGDGVRAQLFDSATGTAIASATFYGSGPPGQSGAVRLAPGSYIVRVDVNAWDDRPHVRGPYRLWLYRFSFGPETARDTIAIGDTVNEAIDVPADVDTFHFYGTKLQHIDIMLQGMAAPVANSGFQAFLAGPQGPIQPVALVGTPPSAANLSDHQTTRLELPFTGSYTLTVTGAAAPPAAVGLYRLAVIAVGTAPESHSAALAIGDSVTTEAIDVPGDWDQFTVTTTPGQELNILFGTGAPCCALPGAAAFDPATANTLAGTLGFGMHIAGPFRVPAGGTVWIAVYEGASVYFRQCFDATCGGLYSYTGPYALQVLALNRAPEVASPAYTLGDTVRTEAILPAGDIDEFTLTATPGDTLSAWYHLLANPVPQGTSITLEAVDQATGAILAGSLYLISASTSFYSPGPFVVPASGRVIIRFRGTGTNGDEVGTAPYEFFVRRGR